MYSLSTTWNIRRHTSITNLISEVESLGFSSIELNSFPEDFLNYLKKNPGIITVSSLHNFCPSPLKNVEVLADDFSLSSLNETERQKAVELTKISIDNAADLGAQAVIIHSGRVQIECQFKKIIEMLSLNTAESQKKAAGLRSEHIALREQKKEKHFSRLMKSLDVINGYALKKNIKLGLENRYYPREIPSFPEIGTILNAFKGGSIHYWHDVGHAQVKEYAGFEKYSDYLTAYGRDMIGVHLHDVSLADDHRPPSFGQIDFTSLKPFLNDSTIKVLEIDKQYSKDDVQEGYSFIKNCLNN